MSRIRKAFSAKEIAKRVAKLGAAIRVDAGASEVFLLGILKGTSCLMADLLRSIEGEVSYGFIDVIRDPADSQIADALEIDFLSHTAITSRQVYLLKDVVSTGVIETYLINQLRQHHPASLRLVALLDRPDLRTVELEADYRVFKVGDGSFVGYGLELEGRGGNLPYIGRL
ncbi:MAG TPA: phosphoribosyltransferase family protein [Thermoanaerobaculia bacterium]|jgi:hypoxanthine phosphoribosyltransferase|nr:phosphoribosyltransferase family protein [Thermoanaerobaculia bacterium]